METIIEQILGYSVMGVSMGALLTLAIYIIKHVRKTKKEIAVTKDAIVEGFKNVILPKDLRINLSSKIKPAIKDGIKEYMEPMAKAYNRLAIQNQLMLSIMSKFSHTEKLNDEEQKLLHDLCKDMGSCEIDID